ncbi:MAG: hypothetical protein ACYSXD_08585 [Planctomycetota bacterium]
MTAVRGIESHMVEMPLNYGVNSKERSSRFSPHSGTLVLSGLILIGFIISWRFGGFPSILIPSFILLAIGLLIDIFITISKFAPKKDSEPIKPLRGILLLVVFYLIFAWMTEGLLPLLEGPNLNKIFYKVEFPFSEATHVVADSENHIYIFSEFNTRIQKYSEDGRFICGWFPTNCKFPHVAIDENDFIHIHAALSLRKYDTSGKLIDEVRMEPEASGWWRFRENSFIWDPNAKKPEQYDEYNEVVKDGDLLPSTELRKAGFKTADARYYKLTRLWGVFPVVSVERYLSEFEGYIMPNPLSLAFTFVFPGFLFYILALIMVWVLEKQAETFTRLKCALITIAILIIAILVFFIGTSLILGIANAQPKGSTLGFLLGLLVIPYLFIVGWVGMYSWQAVQRRLLKTPPAPRNEDFKEDISTAGLPEDPEIPSDNKDMGTNKIMRYVGALLLPFVVLSAIGLVLTLTVHLSIWAGLPLSKYILKVFIGIPVVWLPTVLVFQLLSRDSTQEDSWKVCMRRCPVWMKYMSWVFFIYAFISFGFLLFGMYRDIKYGGSGGGLPKFVSLGLSGFCLVFYSTAMSVLYSVRKILEGRSTKSCPNGHRVPASESFCPYCGEEMTGEAHP